MSNLKLLQIGDVPFHIHSQTIFEDYDVSSNNKVQQLTYSPKMVTTNEQWLNKTIQLSVRGMHISIGTSYNVDSVTQRLREWIGKPTIIIAYEAYNLANHRALGCACDGSCDDDCVFLQSFGVLKGVDVSSSDTSQPSDITLNIEIYTFWKELDNYSWKWGGTGNIPLLGQSSFSDFAGYNDFPIINDNVIYGDGFVTYPDEIYTNTNLYSSEFSDYFNGEEHAVLVRTRVTTPNDVGAYRHLSKFKADNDNQTFILKQNTGNTLRHLYKGSGTTFFIDSIPSGLDSTDIFVTSHSISKIADEFKAYHNGAKIGATVSGLTAFVGNLDYSETVLGQYSVVNSANSWGGDIFDFIYLKTIPTDQQMSIASQKLKAETLTIADLNTLFGRHNWIWWKPSEVIGKYCDFIPPSFQHYDVTVTDDYWSYNGSSSYTNIYSQRLVNFFNGDEGTLISHSKMGAIGWGDDGQRDMVSLFVDSNNYIRLRKPGIANYFQGIRAASGTLKFVNQTPIVTANWFTGSITWNTSAGATGELLVYVDGVQIFITQVGINNFSTVPINPIGANIGARWSGILLWDGDIKDTILAKTVATPAQMALLHTELINGTLTDTYLDSIFGSGNWLWWFNPIDCWSPEYVQKVVNYVSPGTENFFSDFPECDQIFSCNPCSGFAYRDWENELLYYDENFWYDQYNNNCSGRNGGNSAININETSVWYTINTDSKWNAPPQSVYSFSGLPNSGTISISIIKESGLEDWQLSSVLDITELDAALSTDGYGGLETDDRIIVGDVRHFANGKFYRPSFIIRNNIVLTTIPTWSYSDIYPGMIGVGYSRLSFQYTGSGNLDNINISYIHHFRRI